MNVPFTKDPTTILAMDLSMNLPCMVVLRISEDKKIIVQDIVYIDNKNNASKGKNKKSHAQILNEIQKALVQLVHKNQLNDCSNLHVVREKGFSRYAMTTQTLFKVVGVSDLTVFQYLGVKDVTEITPPSVKKLVTGDGKASKQEVDEEVRKYLVREQQGLEFYSDDVSDAIAVGVAYSIKNGLLV